MKRYDFHFLQKVTEAELDAAFDACEQAEQRLYTDLGMIGVLIGASVDEASVPNFTVDVSAGVVVDQTGQRVRWSSIENVDCSVDENSASTAVLTPGNSKILSVFAKFLRVESDPRVDGEQNTVFFDRAESYELRVAQGAEAVSPTAPSLRSDQILLADITITYGQTAIVNANIDTTTRREWSITASSAALTVARGQVEDAVQDICDALASGEADLAAHIAETSLTPEHFATAIRHTSSGTWWDGTTLAPTGSVQDIINEIVSDLASDGATPGSGKIGDNVIARAPAADLADGSLRVRLQTIFSELDDAEKKRQAAHAMSVHWDARQIMDTGERIRGIAGRTGLGSGGAETVDEYIAVGDDASVGGANIRQGFNGPFEWTNRAPPAAPDHLYDVVHTYDEGATAEGRWVVVGTANADAGGYIATSDDATTWTQRTVPVGTFGAGSDITRVIYDKQSGYFIAGGDTGTIIRSADGITWSPASTSPAGMTDLSDMAVNDTGDIIAVGLANSDPMIARSTDGGNTWAIVENPTASNDYRRVEWEPVAQRFVASGQSIGMKKSPTSDGSGTWVAVGRDPFSGFQPIGLRANGIGGLVCIDPNGVAAITFDLGDNWEVWCTSNNHSYYELEFECGRWFHLNSNATTVLLSPPLVDAVQTRT